MRRPAIEVTGLRKSYGAREAVAGVDLHVEEGEILAFLGPNGAGKTTTVEILEGFRPRTAGRVCVLGQDPAGADRHWRARIGIVLQESQPEEYLTVAETVIMWAAYFPASRPVAEVLDLVGLAEHCGQRVGRLSAGQRRRLDLALALVGKPELLFLDEPTTGFDPTARREAWAMIDGLRDLGVTVLLTTHYMDEAQSLADRISVIAAGKIIAEGTPADLAEAASLGTRISWDAREAPLADLPEQLRAAAMMFDETGWHGPLSTSEAEGATKLAVRTNEVTDTVAALLQAAGRRGAKIESLEVQAPTLEDAYLALIGDADPAEGRNP